MEAHEAQSGLDLISHDLKKYEGTIPQRIAQVFPFQHAGVAELVDARDLKSLFPYGK